MNQGTLLDVSVVAGRTTQLKASKKSKILFYNGMNQLEFLNYLIQEGKITKRTPILATMPDIKWSDSIDLDSFGFYDYHISSSGKILNSKTFQNIYSLFMGIPVSSYIPKTKPVPVSESIIDVIKPLIERTITDGINNYDFKFNRVVVWFSGGVASAVAAKLAHDRYGEMCDIVCTDTGSEHDDNWRFLDDVSDWIGAPIKRIKSEDYDSCTDVYLKDKYLVGPIGARCSLMLKKSVRRVYENLRTDLQILGYDAKEKSRAEDFNENNPEVYTWYPLIEAGLSKKDCFSILAKQGIERPVTYNNFLNANCIKEGCVKGQMGYWNEYRKVYPIQFWRKAKIERLLDVAINKQYIGGVRHRLFLDELLPNMGNYRNEPTIQCGLFCQDILS